MKKTYYCALFAMIKCQTKFQMIPSGHLAAGKDGFIDTVFKYVLSVVMSDSVIHCISQCMNIGVQVNLFFPQILETSTSPGILL